MNTKILITAMLMTLTASSAYAQISDVKLSYKTDNRNIAVISGKTNLGDNVKITASVFGDNKTYADITETNNGIDISAILAEIQTVYSDSEGNWSFEWEPSVSGDYDLYISENKTQNPKIDLFVASGMHEKFASLVTGTETELNALFANEMTFKSFYTDDDNRALITDKSKTGTALYNIRRGIVDVNNIENYLDTALLMAALGEKANSAALDTVIKNITDKQLSQDWYSVYNASSDAVKNGIALAVAPLCTNKTISEFNSDLKVKLILKGVQYAANWTDAQTYLDLHSNTKYQSYKQKVAMAVVGNEYTDLTALDNAIAQVSVQTFRPSYPSGGGGGSSSGGGGGGGSIPAAPATKPTDTDNTKVDADKENHVIFNDVSSEHWAYDCINYLRWNDIVDGDENGDFRPNNNITRAEFVKILCEAFKLSTSSSVSFNDVSAGSWYGVYVQTAAGNEIVMGDNEGNFKPDAPITRQDIAVIIHRLAVKKEIAMDREKNFADSVSVADYAKTAVSQLAGADIIGGDGENFRPYDNATRAEAAAIIYRTINSI